MSWLQPYADGWKPEGRGVLRRRKGLAEFTKYRSILNDDSLYIPLQVIVRMRSRSNRTKSAHTNEHHVRGLHTP